MDIAKRLFRRPVSTAVWVAVLTLAALLIGVGASVLHAAHAMREELDSKQTTIAVHRLPREQNEDGTFTTTGDLQSGPLFDEDIAYLCSLPQVKDIDLRYLSGAYIEGVYTKLGLADFFGKKQDNGLGVNDGSNGVVLIGKVEGAFTLNYNSVKRYDLSAFGLGSYVGQRYNCAILRVEDALAIHPDYPLYSRYDGDEDYTGRVTIMFPAFGDDTTSFFKIGKRYAVRGAYDPMPSGYGEDYPIGKEPLCPNVNLISESLLSAFIEGDSLACYRDIEAEIVNMIDPFTGEIALGHATPVLSRGERVPVAVEWNGTAEELAKDEVWGKFIEEYRMAQHAFPVLGTNRLESMYSFVQNEASIVHGRSFTQDEYDTGAKVLVMDEGVASSAGLSVGDKVSIKQFRPAIGYDEGNQSFHNDFYAASDEYNNPTLGSNVFFHGLPEGEAEEFTIVGLYRIENEWKDALCSFTPNTLFIPRAAQTELAFGGPSKKLGTRTTTGFSADGIECEVEEPDISMGGVCGVYMSIILKNGSMNEFLERLEADCEYENIPFGEDGYLVKRVKGLNNKTFFCFDQGYEAVKASIEGVWASALKLLGMTCALALLLFIAYLLLYQAMERSTLGIMRSLGAKPQRTRRYLFISGLVLTAVGIAVGTALSAAFAGLIADKLAGAVMGENAELMRESLAGGRLPAWLYALIALIELIIASVLLHAHAAHLSKKEPRKLLVK
ncbi:MAG: ABC transporter permease [Clostridia bacterium]|nr:ABC transporter permease [Clostridia bacterium]